MRKCKKKKVYFLFMDGVTFVCEDKADREELKQKLNEEKNKMIQYYYRKFSNEVRD